MKNFKYFDNENAYNSERNGNYEEPWVSWTVGKGVDYNKSEEEKRLSTPLTFEILSDGVVVWSSNSVVRSNYTYTNSESKTIQYKKNNGAWTSITAANGSSAPSIPVVTGDVIQFIGRNDYYFYEDTDNDCDCSNGFYGTTADFKVSGNIMSLVKPEEFSSFNTLYYYRLQGDIYYISLAYLFAGCTTLIDASGLILPCTEQSCYEYMFSNCTRLVTPPQLPSTTVKQGCYYSMFYGCTSLTTTPELPANTIDINCYGYMFCGCTSISTAPELPATSLYQSCYNNMFKNCTSLTTAPELPATSLADYCYRSMFSGCTSLTTAPELPATTLVSFCYNDMFRDCSNLQYIKAMFTTTPSINETGNWVNGVSPTGTFVKNASATWTTTGVNGVPTGWTVQTATE